MKNEKHKQGEPSCGGESEMKKDQHVTTYLTICRGEGNSSKGEGLGKFGWDQKKKKEHEHA